MRITDSRYVTSAVSTEGILITDKPQIAVAGRSNVGKSSFINFITNNGKLCRTSGEPGRTRMINYFEINKGEFYFVDLPGYGFARASHEARDNWADFINIYMTNSLEIANVFVLVDLRHPPSELDTKLVNYLNMLNLPFTIIATKGDKISRPQQQKHIKIIANGLKVGIDNILVSSALNKSGGDAILDRIENILINYHEQKAMKQIEEDSEELDEEDIEVKD